LVIISKISKFFKSIRIKLLFTYLFVGIVPLFIFVNALIGTVEKYYLDQKVNYIQRQINILSSQLTLTGFLDGNFSASSDYLKYELNQLSKELNGRILLVNKNHIVVKDSNALEEGKTILIEEIVRGLKGESYLKIVKESNIIQSVAPIKKDNTQEITGAIYISASTKDIQKSIVELRNNFILVFFITLIIIFIISYYYSEVLTRPFKELLRIIKKIPEGHFDQTINVKGHQEIEEISTAFNQMTQQLQVIDQSRQEFVSNVSHELKTPLASIKVLADSLLSQENIPAELYREFLVDINAEIDREDKIINDLLSLVKMDKNQAALNIEKVNVNELMEQILKRLKPLASKNSIELIFESFREVIAELDEVKISLAFTNLIENAIKYNKENGWINVTLNADHKFFYIKVTDSGIGIPKEELDKIFDRFYRVDKARSRETGGTGLGLSITKNAILVHKGSIKVKSEENKGTTFSIRIPLYYIL
jgi:signal transduction histidine kinase